MRHLPMQDQDPLPRAGGGDSRKLLEDIHRYLGIIRRGWRLIALGVLLALTAAGIYLARSKAIYRASARLLVIQQGGRPVQVAATGDPFQNVQGNIDSLFTHIMIMRSPVIAGRAVVMSGLSTISADSVLQTLTVKLPDPTARIIELAYVSHSRDQSRLVMQGMIDSYNRFLKDNYQKNSNDVLGSITKVRDELNLDLKKLEQEYLEYRQKNPAYSADEKGRSFIVCRLDQWDQAMNQVLVRSLQLKSQLELGRKLSGEGADPATVASALNQLGALSGGSTIVPQGSSAAAGVSQSLDKIAEDLDAAEIQRNTAEQLLTHLLREQDEFSKTDRFADKEIRQAFLDDPDVVQLQNRLRSARTVLQERERLARSTTDASVANSRRRIEDLEAELERLWKTQKPVIAGRLSRDSGSGLNATVRTAEIDLLALRAKESALRDRLEQVATNQIDRLLRERERLVAAHGQSPAQVGRIDERITQVRALKNRSTSNAGGEVKPSLLLASIERSLESVEKMRIDLQKNFEEDLSASKSTEISQLAENNLRENRDRQRTLFNSVVDQLKQAQLVSDYGSVAAQTIAPTTVYAESPNLIVILSLAIVIGVAVGSSAAFAVDTLEARVRSLAEIRALVDLPIVGLIPQLSSETPSETPVGLLSHVTPRSAFAEAYKLTRTNLEFLRRNQQCRYCSSAALTLVMARARLPATWRSPCPMPGVVSCSSTPTFANPPCTRSMGSQTSLASAAFWRGINDSIPSFTRRSWRTSTCSGPGRRPRTPRSFLHPTDSASCSMSFDRNTKW